MTRWTITVDCERPALLAAFWSEALGYVEAAPPAGFDSWAQWFVATEVPEDEWDDGAAIEDPGGILPRISFLAVPEGKVVKNRLHLDLQVSGGRARPGDERRDAIAATVERLVLAGAMVLAEHEVGGRVDHVVLADPEGNEFCVV